MNIEHWTFGGGTAMMLQINHRESNDVDIFLPDPQYLPFLDPQKREFEFEIRPTKWSGDGVRSLRFVFDTLGEVDFIVGGTMTASPMIKTDIEGESVLLETIPEIITKKIFFRGSSLRPRDIFDIAAAGEQHADLLVEALRAYPDRVKQALSAMAKLKPDFVDRAIALLAIKDGYRTIAKTAAERARKILDAV